MRFAIVYPRTPPDVDGIADHGSLLGEQLVLAGHDVVLLCRAPGREGMRIAAERGLRVVDAFPGGSTRDVRGLLRALVRQRPDVVLLQFEQFAWGGRGFNPPLAALFAFLAVRLPGAVRVLFAHERWAPVRSPRSAVMSGYQRLQFALLQATATRTYVPTDRWHDGPGAARIRTLPVSSNLPEAAPIGRTTVAPGPPDAVRFVWFGSIGGARLPYLAAAIEAIAADDRATLTYVGVDDAAAAQAGSALGPRLRVLPPQPDATVSSLLRDADESLCPYADGVSARRGTFLASLQHGRSILTTVGPSTDAELRSDAEAGLFRACPAGDPARFGTLVRDAMRDARGDTAAEDARREAYRSRYSTAAAAAFVVADVRRLRNGARRS